MGLAHGADIYRAWGNVVVNGLFAPIPRLYAAGATYIPRREMPLAYLDEQIRQLGDLVVQYEPPRPATAGVVLLRHAETAAVEAGLERVAEAVRATPALIRN